MKKIEELSGGRVRIRPHGHIVRRPLQSAGGRVDHEPAAAEEDGRRRSYVTTALGGGSSSGGRPPRAARRPRQNDAVIRRCRGLTNGETKRFFKVFRAWQEEEEQEWLKEMARQGWILKRTRPPFYTFERGEPADVELAGFQIDARYRFRRVSTAVQRRRLGACGPLGLVDLLPPAGRKRDGPRPLHRQPVPGGAVQEADVSHAPGHCAADRLDGAYAQAGRSACAGLGPPAARALAACHPPGHLRRRRLHRLVRKLDAGPKEKGLQPVRGMLTRICGSSPSSQTMAIRSAMHVHSNEWR